MNLAAVLIPPSLDAKQVLRLRRVSVAALGYVLAAALVAVAWMFGILPASTVLTAAAASLVINLGLYVVIRSGFNLRFADPSLTRFQILAAITILMYVVYHMDDGRNVALIGCFVVFLFGIFRLDAREFTVVTLYTLAAYALVVDLLMHWRPQAIHDVPLEWLSWLGLAVFLPWFIVIGGQISRLKRRMRESAAQLRLFADNVPAMTVSLDENLRYVFASKRYVDFFGFNQADIVGKHLREVVGEDAYREIEGHFAQALQGHSVTYQRTRKLANNEPRYLEVKLLPHIGDQGAVLGCFVVTSDITEHKQAEQALRESAENLRLFTDNVPAITVSWDENLHCRFANKAFAAVFGLAVEDVIGKHLRELYGEEVYREVEGHFVQALQGHSVTYQRAHKLANGESRFLEIKLLPHIGDQGKVLGCFAVTTDITEHKLVQEHIQNVAYHDNLTGLPNRLLFNDRLEQAISLAKRDSRRFALLYLDLDKFKPVNDTLGHTAGDELLQAVAARIRREVRESDTVARVGGDEFTVILPDIARREEVETVARKIIAAVATPFQIGGQKQVVYIGTSIGIALYPADGRDADALIKAADAAMYRAKQAESSFRFYAA